MREQVKGGDTRGRPVGGGVAGGDWAVREWKGLDIHGKHNKAGAFYIKKKGDCLFFFPLDAFRAECHVLPRPAGSERLSSAIAFGTSEAHLRGLKFLPSEHLHQTYRRPDILDVTA